MAGASDKARFYLEQSVPELREWERREIFSKVSVPTSFTTVSMLISIGRDHSNRSEAVNI